MYTAYLKGSLKLSKTGEWWHNGQVFQNPKVSQLFTRSVVWDADAQEYFIQIGAQRASFDCEDTAYFVTAIDDSKSPWVVSISDGGSEPLRPETLRIGDDEQIYCNVHGTHRARLSRAAHQTLLRYVESDNALSIDGKSYRIAKA